MGFDPTVSGLRTAIYLRKSRADLMAEASGEGETLSRHRQTLLETADRLHLAVGKIYPEVVSGETIAARPQMQQLLADLEAGLWDAVLVMEVARLTRGSQLDQGIIANAFKFTQTLIITPDKVYDPNNAADEDMLDFGMFFSRFEWKTINKRQQAGKRAAMREGKFVSSVAPYGYRRQKLKGEKGYTLVPDPETAPIIQDIFRMFLDGMNQNRIANHLNAAGVPTAGGGRWTVATVRGILRNPHYAGYTANGFRPVVKEMRGGQIVTTRPKNRELQLFEGRHEALVSRDAFSRAAARLRTHKAPPIPKVHGMTNPLSGLIICGHCGKKMQRRNMPGAPALLLCTTPGCPCVSSPLEDVEELLLHALQTWLNRFETTVQTADDCVPDLPHIRQELTGVAHQLTALAVREQRAFALVESGVYTAADFSSRRAALQAERTRLTAAQAALQSKISLAEAFLAQHAARAPRTYTVRTAYGLASDCRTQNELLRSVLDHAAYYKTIKRTRACRDTDLHLEIYPRFCADS